MIRKLAILAGIVAGQLCMAQVPAGAPAGTTGLCNDGTYYSGASKTGACSGHKGLKKWYGAAAKASTAGAKTSTTKTSSMTAASAPATPPASRMSASPAPAKSAGSTPAPSTPASSASKTSASTKTAAPGGSPGLVWLNTASNVYHCYGTQYYGKTKGGQYMSEADAKAKGAHSEGGKPCSK